MGKVLDYCDDSIHKEVVDSFFDKRQNEYVIIIQLQNDDNHYELIWSKKDFEDILSADMKKESERLRKLIENGKLSVKKAIKKYKEMYQISSIEISKILDEIIGERIKEIKNGSRGNM